MLKWHGLIDDAHIRTVIMESNQSKNSQSSFNPSCNNALLYIIISTQMIHIHHTGCSRKSYWDNCSCRLLGNFSWDTLYKYHTCINSQFIETMKPLSSIYSFLVNALTDYDAHCSAISNNRHKYHHNENDVVEQFYCKIHFW